MPRDTFPTRLGPRVRVGARAPSDHRTPQLIVHRRRYPRGPFVNLAVMRPVERPAGHAVLWTGNPLPSVASTVRQAARSWFPPITSGAAPVLASRIKGSTPRRAP